ncbi:MAG: SPFH domain-containing protein [Lachnospiraceae bacterium]|nr:SPFH domain-containing protein [Lachnospiraceae bacterium]
MGLKALVGGAVDGLKGAASNVVSAGVGAVAGTIANQYKEFFYCNAIDKDTLMVRGHRRAEGRSANKGDDNIITNGSVIAVADGQCMLIVDQGRVVDLCAVPGEYVYDQSSEPSIFSGNLGDSIKETFKNIGKRFTFGGDSGKEQRVYYINTKEISGNTFGTPKKVPFRVVDERAGIDMDVSIGAFGKYSYRIADPITFYTYVAGNTKNDFRRSEIDGQLKAEVLSAIQPAFAKVSAMGIRYSQLPGQTEVIADAMNEVLTEKWKEKRGLEIYMFAVESVSADEEDEKTIKELQKNAAFMDPTRLAAYAGVAQADAMKMAASNTSAGPMMAFMGMNAAQNAGGGLDINSLMAQGQAMRQQQAAQQPQMQPAAQKPANAWTCSCGATATGNFCPECGSKKPEEPAGWTCSCGAVNQGKFCPNCGAKKPAGVPQYKCDKCGWMPEDPKNPPKFCPECGDPFGDEDIVQ